MPTEISVTLYQFYELTPESRDRAISDHVDALARSPWSAGDIEDIDAAITYTFAQHLGTPGVERCGEADFPGIPDVSLAGWNVTTDTYACFDGVLTPGTAPRLPWPDGVDTVVLADTSHGTDVFEDGAADVRALRAAVMDAIVVAAHAGQQQGAYLRSAERAEEDCQLHDDEWRYLPNGTRYLYVDELPINGVKPAPHHSPAI